MRFTVLGSTGFIGRRIVRHLRSQGLSVETPSRDFAGLQGKHLGHVIYAIGLTGDFRSRPRATIEAHVTVLQDLMERTEYDSWLYLSSTRVYGGLPAGEPATENTALSVQPGLDSLYDLSKLLGESICLAKNRSTIRVARLSNVYGAGQSVHSFLGSVVADLIRHQTVTVGESPQSSKDYVSVDIVVRLLQLIAQQGRERLYNVAGGHPVTHQALAEVVRGLGYSVQFSANARTRVFPTVDIARITAEFEEMRASILDDLPSLLQEEAALQLKVRENEYA